MGLFKQAEFAKKCGIHQAYLTVNRKRKKVIVENGMVDDTNPINIIFMQKCLSRPRKEVPLDSKNAVAPPRGDKPKKVKPSKNERTKYDDGFDLDLERKQIEIERAQIGKQLMQSKLGKESGALIPFEAVKMAMDQHLRDITTFVGQGLQNLLTEFSHKAKLNLNQKGEMDSSMKRIVNDSINRAIDATNIALRNIQKEFSKKRGVGERA